MYISNSRLTNRARGLVFVGYWSLYGQNFMSNFWMTFDLLSRISGPTTGTGLVFGGTWHIIEAFILMMFSPH